MTNKGVAAFVEAILADQPPKRFPAAHEDGDVLRVAVELRASQSGVARPDPEFVEELHFRLATIANDGAPILPHATSGWRGSEHERRGPWTASRSRPRRVAPRPFVAAGKAAAAVLLVASTFTATNLVGRHSAAPVAERTSSAVAVRSGELLTADGRPRGRAYVYNGNPVWVFMDVHGSGLSGVYSCQLELADGTNLAAGAVVVHNGSGEWAYTVSVQASQVRRATLVTSTGAPVASAIFS